MAKLGVVLGDYNNNREDVDAGQIMRDVAEVNLFWSFKIHIHVYTEKGCSKKTKQFSFHDITAWQHQNFGKKCKNPNTYGVIFKFKLC